MFWMGIGFSKIEGGIMCNFQVYCLVDQVVFFWRLQGIWVGRVGLGGKMFSLRWVVLRCLWDIEQRCLIVGFVGLEVWVFLDERLRIIFIQMIFYLRKFVQSFQGVGSSVLALFERQFLIFGLGQVFLFFLLRY